MVRTEYYVYMIIQNKNDKRAWLCPILVPFLSYEFALQKLEEMKENHMVLSAWIERVCGSDQRVVFHKCYVDVLGDVHKDR